MTSLQWALWNTINNKGLRNPWWRTTSERLRSELRQYKRYKGYVLPKKEIIYWSSAER